jgi:mannitol-specific phosphotransferase system IIBC component
MKPFKQITIVFLSGIIYLVSSVLIGSESILKNSTQKQEETKSKKETIPQIKERRYNSSQKKQKTKRQNKNLHPSQKRQLIKTNPQKNPG